MTARRVTILLAAGFIVIVFAIWLSSKRHLERATLAGDLVLPGLEHALNSITEVRLTRGDDTHATLKKGASDWGVAERDNYPADSGKVRKFLLDLAALDVVEEKTRTPANYAALGVEDVSSSKAGGTRVEAVTPGKTYALIVGKSSSAKSGYVRVSNSEQSFLAAPLITVDADPKRWLDHAIVDIPQERVKEIVARPAEGPGYTATRANKDQADFTVSDVPKGRELSNPSAASPIAGSLVSLTLDDVRRPPAAEAGSRTAASHTIFRTFNGLELDVTGRKDGTRPFVSVLARSTAKETETEAQTINARTQGWEYEVPGYKYDAIFRPLEDLLKKPPEPPKKADKAKKADKKTGKAEATQSR